MDSWTDVQFSPDDFVVGMQIAALRSQWRIPLVVSVPGPPRGCHRETRWVRRSGRDARVITLFRKHSVAASGSSDPEDSVGKETLKVQSLDLLD